MTATQLIPTSVAQFILAGNATFTVRSQKTETRYTFKVRKAKAKDVWYVSMLTGSDNENDYAYIGLIDENGVFRLTKASQMTKESAPVLAFAWVHGRAAKGMPIVGVEVWHAGKCGRCGRTLTVPESIQSGFGPECIQMM